MERRASRLRDPEAEVSPRGVRDDQPEEADEAPLLADIAADEVVVGQRQEPVLLAAFAESDADGAARAHRDQRLAELVAHLLRDRARVEERHHAEQDVLEPLHLAPHLERRPRALPGERHVECGVEELTSVVDAGAEQVMPDSIDDDAAGEWMLRMGQPSRQLHSAALVAGH